MATVETKMANDIEKAEQSESDAGSEEANLNGVTEPVSGEEEASSNLDRFVISVEDIEEDEDPATLDARERKYKHWQESHFAVGSVNVTWQDDRPCCRPKSSQHLPIDSQICCSAVACGCIGADRVGNLAVLAQSTEEYDHVEIVNEETGEQRTSRRKRPKLLCVLGPYWPVNFFLTYPLIIGISCLTAWRNLQDAPLFIVITWSMCTFLCLFSLAMIACRNPGVLYRHTVQPPDSEDWRWNDQAKTFRPPKARFDPECQAVIEGFDHTCPWTGTAIGSRNMFWFRTFVTMVPVCIGYAVVLNLMSFRWV